MIPYTEENTYFPRIRSSDYLFLLRWQYEETYLSYIEYIFFETKKKEIPFEILRAKICGMEKKEKKK